MDSRRDSLKDAVLLSLAGIALIAEVLLLLHQLRVIHLPFSGRSESERGGAIGEVLEKRSSLKRRASRSLSWYPSIAGDRIHWNDTLLTGSDSSARIRIDGEGEVFISADTLLKFTRSETRGKESMLDLDLSQGRLMLTSTNQGVNLKIRDRDMELKPGTQVVVSKPALGGQSEIHVKRGEIRVRPSGGAPADLGSGVTLMAGEAAQVHPERGLARFETSLRLSPKFPTSGSPILAQAPHERVRLFWEGDEATSIEVDETPEFSSPRRIATEGFSAEVDLAPGRYYWRLRRKLAMSEAQEFVILPDITTSMRPRNGTIYLMGSPVPLFWEPIEGASQYYVEVSGSSEFKDFLLQSDVVGTRTELTDLSPGKYFWRVRVKHPSWGVWRASNAGYFVVRRGRRGG